MDHAITAQVIIGLTGFVLGGAGVGLGMGRRIAELRGRLDDREHLIVNLEDDLRGKDGALAMLRDEVAKDRRTSISQLRLRIILLEAQIAELEPDAARYRAQAAQRKAALAKANEVNRARAAAKAAA